MLLSELRIEVAQSTRHTEQCERACGDVSVDGGWRLEVLSQIALEAGIVPGNVILKTATQTKHP